MIAAGGDPYFIRGGAEEAEEAAAVEGGADYMRAAARAAALGDERRRVRWSCARKEFAGAEREVDKYWPHGVRGSRLIIDSPNKTKTCPHNPPFGE